MVAATGSRIASEEKCSARHEQHTPLSRRILDPLEVLVSYLSTPRRILITGASRGIGAELARQLAPGGHRLVLVARHRDALETTAASLPGPTTPEIVPMDVTQPEHVGAGMRAVLGRGPIDVLVNNAGSCCQGCWLHTPMERLRAELELNYWGAVGTCRALLPAMIERGQGTIVNVSSLLGSVSAPTTINYSASKAALEAFTHGLRGEVARHGVHCTVFVAPHTQTDMGAATEFDGVRSLPVAYTAAKLVRAIDRRPRVQAPGPVYGLFLRLAALAPGFMERQLAASTQRVLEDLSRSATVTRAPLPPTHTQQGHTS